MTDRCSLLSADLGEPLPGTAAHAPAWLLIEDPGPWGHDALSACTIDAEVAGGLAERAEAAGVRVQLIRRLDRAPETKGRRTVFWVHSGPGEPWARRSQVTERGLAKLDPAPAAATTPPARLGEVVQEDLLLVCTHAKRDACCAQFGRPVAESVHLRAPERTWETSHTGGHRFAGVLLVLPEGLTFGRLAKKDVASVLKGLRAGEVPLEHYRGRSADPGPGQAAEIAVRREAEAAGRSAVRVREVSEDGGATVVALDVDGEAWRAVVATRPMGTVRAVSCGGTPEDRPWHEVVGVARQEARPEVPAG